MTELEYRKALARGEQARRNGVRFSECPYRTNGDARADAWREGWMAEDGRRKA